MIHKAGLQLKRATALLSGLIVLTLGIASPAFAASSTQDLASAVMGPGASTKAVSLEADTLNIANSGALKPYLSLSSTPFVVVSWAPKNNSTIEFSIIGDATAARKTLSGLFPTVPISTTSVPFTAVPTLVDDRQNDPGGPGSFTSGDYINIAGGGMCGDSFTYTGNVSGNKYNYTAQHCNGSINSAVSNGSYVLGYISTQYAGSPNYADLESFSCGQCNAHVWYNTTGGYHNVHGDCVSGCYGGNLVTTDGIKSGELPDWTTQFSGPGCFTINGAYRCGLEEAYNANSNVQSGDSGSPVYQRTSNNNVWAAGEMIAYGASTHYVWYETDAYIEQIANVTIYTG